MANYKIMRNKSNNAYAINLSDGQVVFFGPHESKSIDETLTGEVTTKQGDIKVVDDNASDYEKDKEYK